MAKEKHIRIRRLTCSRLAQAAEEMELSISELADRILTDALDDLEQEEEEDGDEDENGNGIEDDDHYSCPACGESVLPDDEECESCGEDLSEEE